MEAMDVPTWSRLRPILERALELDGSEEEAYLVRATDGDERLLRLAREYLEADRAGAGPLEDPTPPSQGQLAGEPLTAPAAGRTVGPWLLERKLGQGGMGTVWLASRGDGSFEQRVALKLVAPHLASGELGARFEREQRILATLEHPGIARLVDAGRGEGELPYLAMEYVEGLPIDRWCAQGPSMRERIELFRRVCEAVAYAHRRLVVHRDLKPANVLVDSEGRPRLLDFGIAGVLQGDTEEDAVLTRTGRLPFTPTYASPEQIRGEPVGTQGDVYSLGVILFQLLTGRPPHAFEHSTPTEMLSALERGDPPLASKAAPALADRLRGDLDAIVACALHPEPERRYGSVEALAEDLRRYLDGLPVAARPDTAGYRLRKFLRRNRLATAISGALVTALVLGLAGTTYQFLRAERARGEEQRLKELANDRADELERLAERLAGEQATAQRHFDTAQRRFDEIRRFSTELIFDLERTLQNDGPTRARERLVGLGLEHLDRLADEAREDFELRGELAAAYARMGDVLGHPTDSNLGRSEEAVAAYARALELLDGVPGARELRHRELPLVAHVGERLAGAQLVLGHPDRARASLELALGLLGPVADDAPDADLVVRSGLVATSRRLEQQAGRLAIAGDLSDEELRLSGLLLERHPGKTAALYGRGSALLAARELAEARRDPARARELLEQACLSMERAAESAPRVVQVQRGLAAARTLLGETRMRAGEPGAALEVLEPAVATLRDLVAGDPGDQQAARDLAIAGVHLGKAQLAAGRLPEALATGEATAERARRGRAANPGDIDLGSVEAGALLLQAQALAGLGRTAESLERLEASQLCVEQVIARAADDPQRRRACMVNCLEVAEAALELADGAGPIARAAVGLGLELAEAARAEGVTSPLDEQIDSRLRATGERVQALDRPAEPAGP